MQTLSLAVRLLLIVLALWPEHNSHCHCASRRIYHHRNGLWIKAERNIVMAQVTGARPQKEREGPAQAPVLCKVSYLRYCTVTSLQGTKQRFPALEPRVFLCYDGC